MYHCILYHCRFGYIAETERYIVNVERQKDVRVIMSMMMLCDDNVIIEYDRRRSGLPSAPVVMGHDNNRTEI